MTYPDPVLASVMAVAATAALLYWWSAARSTAKRVAATAAARLADAALRRANQGQRILCLVNPFGGGGSAPAMFERTVRPVLEARGFEVERRDTQRAKHAWELAHELATTTASKYAAVCVVSGDGLVHEVVNGFMDDTGNKTGGNKTLVPILVIPIGSSNGIFATLNPSMRFESSEVQCRHAAYGDTVLKSDVFKVNVEPYESSSSSSSNNSTFGILSISYGIVAEGDHAAETEFRRYGPTLSKVFAAIKVIAANSTYYARISYADEEQGGKETSIEGEYSLIAVINATFLSYDIFAHPDSKLDDGVLYLIHMPPMSRLKLMYTLMKLTNGDWKGIDYVKAVRTKRVVIEPKTGPQNPVLGHLVADGETVPIGRATVQIHPKLIPLLH